jgi:hypothetical protein
MIIFIFQPVEFKDECFNMSLTLKYCLQINGTFLQHKRLTLLTLIDCYLCEVYEHEL